MTGHKSFSKLVANMPPERQARVKAKTKQLQTEMLLSQLLQLSGLTQQELAEELGIAQPSLSKMEGQSDMRISTLSRLVKSLGGTLELVARLPTGDVRLKQFVDED